MFNAILVDFQLINANQPQLLQALISQNEQKRDLIIQVLTQAVVHLRAEFGVTKLLAVVQLLRMDKIDQHLLNLLEYMGERIASVQLINFIFTFKLSNQTFIFLQQIQKRMNVQQITENVLIPLQIFLQQLPKQIQDNDALNECCGLMLDIFQLHFAEINTLELDTQGAIFTEASLIFIQNLLQLIRRGYGRNERFCPMIKKLLKTCKFNQKLVQVLAFDDPSDTLTDRKSIIEILVEFITESENIDEFIVLLIAYSS